MNWKLVGSVLFWISFIGLAGDVTYCLYIDGVDIVTKRNYSSLTMIAYFIWAFVPLVLFLISCAVNPKRSRVIAFSVLFLLMPVIYLACKPIISY